MSQRKLKDREIATPTLRRSPRFTATAIDASLNNKVHNKQINTVSQSSEKSSTRLRRSARVISENHQNNGTVNNLEKRVTRSSTQDAPRCIVLGCASTDNSVEKSKCDSRNPRNGQRNSNGTSRVSKCTLDSIERPVPSSEVAGSGEEDDNGTVKKRARLKRKRTQGMEEESSNGNGWTNQQELALQSAYFAAKATPNFWKRVARMVPGKSAKECFDKIHSDFLTPPQPQPRSRAKKMNTSSYSPCATILLQSAEKNTKKLRYSKPKNHLSHKTMRQILQKQYELDRDKGADLFSVLESSTDPTTELFTPERNKEGLHYLKRCLERSSSAHKKHLSRFSGSSGANLTSPPVLKPIKNKALHERYIDQLHCREAKRKTAISRTTKGNKNKNDHKDENVRKMDAIKAAKNALISEARDAINHFQNLQIRGMNSFDDDEDDDENCDDDAEE